MTETPLPQHAHGPGPAHAEAHDEVDVAAMFERPWWEERYGQPDAVWSGRPNTRLVEQAGDLAPGTALEVGCGEGADAIWLAERGWTVTAVDFSRAGLDRARQHAEAAGAQVAGRITWERVDVRDWTPEAGSVDLVTAHYFHQPAALRPRLFTRLAAAVRPGGTLLVVGHHPSDVDSGVRTPGPPEELRDTLYTADEVASGLDPADWQVLVAAALPREHAGGEHGPVTVHDAVLRAVRR